jgi:tetratricopeptide (TPR) repeat protein
MHSIRTVMRQSAPGLKLPSAFRSRLSVYLSAVLITLPVVAHAQSMSRMSHDEHDTTSALVLGTVDFPTKANDASHKAFIRGVLLLHNFHYPRAAVAFQDAEKLDPTDVMGYWGEAMTYTHPVWNQQDTAAARKALMKLAPTREARLALARSPREREWLASVEDLYTPNTPKAQRDTAWSRALGMMHASDPADIEATTFYAVSLLGLNQGQRESVAYEKAYELVLPIFKSHPHHPGAAHYLIHATDDPSHAALGLEAARAYGEIAPSATHAIHMTSHIFLALGKWDDVVSANRKAQATIKGGALSGHIVHWLHYALIQQGRYKEADVWLDSMVKQAHTRPATGAYESWDAAGLMAAANLIVTRQWAMNARDVRVDTTSFIADGSPEGFGDLAAIEFGTGFRAINIADMPAFDSTLKRMKDRRARVAGNPLMATSSGMSEVMEKSLRGIQLWKTEQLPEALAAFQSAATEEASLPMQFGPPMTIKPPRELAGELLLAMNRPADAKKEFELAQTRTPRRPTVLIGLARSEWALGNRAAARKIYKELVGIWHSADTGFPELVEARARAK